MNNANFLNREQMANAFAIDFLEHFITPVPTEEQIKLLEMFLLSYLEENDRLEKISRGFSSA